MFLYRKICTVMIWVDIEEQMFIYMFLIFCLSNQVIQYSNPENIKPFTNFSYVIRSLVNWYKKVVIMEVW